MMEKGNLIYLDMKNVLTVKWGNKKIVLSPFVLPRARSVFIYQLFDFIQKYVENSKQVILPTGP